MGGKTCRDPSLEMGLDFYAMDCTVHYLGVKDHQWRRKNRQKGTQIESFRRLFLVAFGYTKLVWELLKGVKPVGMFKIANLEIERRRKTRIEN